MNTLTQRFWLSLGENCLADGILKRFARKSFSTPYSHGRSNIDYAIALEERGYEKLLDKNYLVVGDAWGQNVVRSSLYVDADPIFDSSCTKGFEFTHHDPLQSIADCESYQRKISRLIEIRATHDVVFLYHHRKNDKSNSKLLHEKLKRFKSFYCENGHTCCIVLFYQLIVTTEASRGLVCKGINDEILEFELHTVNLWGGVNQDLFWARVDDDLISEMFNRVDSYLIDGVAHNASSNIIDI